MFSVYSINSTRCDSSIQVQLFLRGELQRRNLIHSQVLDLLRLHLEESPVLAPRDRAQQSFRIQANEQLKLASPSDLASMKQVATQMKKVRTQTIESQMRSNMIMNLRLSGIREAMTRGLMSISQSNQGTIRELKKINESRKDTIRELRRSSQSNQCTVREQRRSNRSHEDMVRELRTMNTPIKRGFREMKEAFVAGNNRPENAIRTPFRIAAKTLETTDDLHPFNLEPYTLKSLLIMLRALAHSLGPLRLSTMCIQRFSGKKYILSQFPYPSGQLHLGHARVYFIGDTLARYYKLHQFQVTYPIGFDSFGLPAENAAMLHCKDPREWTENNITQMKDQLGSLEIGFDWERQLATHTPQYYKHTQRIFLDLLERGLAYKAESLVNWDPVDKTVLANEQVDNLGRSWRSGALVEKKMLSQWFLRITHYAEQLQGSLGELGWVDRVKAMQAGWIGHQKGYTCRLQLTEITEQGRKYGFSTQRNFLDVFIKGENDLLIEDCVIRLNEDYSEEKDCPKVEEVLLGSARNPITDEPIRIILGSEQNGIKAELVQPKTHQINRKSNQTGEHKLKQIQLTPTTVMRIKDWSISRQRYWGTPIPIIYCQLCGVVPVPDDQLPVVLPPWTNSGNPLLSPNFKACSCPKCGRPAERETDTMDTFVDSSWYFLRFLDNQNPNALVERAKADYWMPVDVYVGGIEHAIMHLLYARFVMRTLADQGVTGVREPFKELVVQGLVKGRTIRHKLTGKYLKSEEVSNYKEEELEISYEKMSKSKFNGLNPLFLVDKYGPDALRMALFFAAPPEHDIDFNEDLLVSADRFLRKVEETYSSQGIQTNTAKSDSAQSRLKNLCEKYTQHVSSIKKILTKLQNSIEKRLMHVYIANCMQLFNQIKSISKQNPNDPQLQSTLFHWIFLPVLSVVAPRTAKTILKTAAEPKLEWPHSRHLGDYRQYTVMKANKLVRRGAILLESADPQDQLMQKLALPHESIVKINKNNIIIILK